MLSGGKLKPHPDETEIAAIHTLGKMMCEPPSEVQLIVV